MGVASACIRRSYTKPEQVPKGMRQRLMSTDPQRRSSEGKARRKSKLIMIPTNPQFVGNSRPDRTSAQRLAMKESKSPEQLFSKLNDAVSNELVDHSVIGAAMQTCGI